MQIRPVALGQEKRRASRFPCHGEVNIRTLGISRFLSGKMLDLSLTGCQLRPDGPEVLERDELVEISFCALEIAMVARGRVRHVHPDQSVGIEFTDISDRYRLALRQLMDELGRQWLQSRR